MIIEVVAFNIESALNAQKGGADRVELCAGPMEGGTTPSYGIIDQARRTLNIDVYVMIRPRGGDFVYSVYEFNAMKRDIEACKRLSVDGIVLGMLDKQGRVDKVRCRSLVDLARPMKVTFHRAFDVSRDSFEALDDLAELGIERVLTSGRQPKAEEGTDLIRECVMRSAGKVSVMPGSGIHAGNARKIVQETGAREIHLSGASYRSSDIPNYNHMISFVGNFPTSGTDLFVTDPEKVKAVRSLFAA
jgi:copper homeostasis protein